MNNRKLSPHQVPIAFVDKTGYVTPFNGRIDETLSGWYIYDKRELDMLLVQQRKLEEQRMVTERGVIDVKYAITDVDIKSVKEDTDEETPDWAKQILGVENAAPYLQLANSDNAPKPKVIPTAKVDNFVEEATNVNLTLDEIAELGERNVTAEQMLGKVFSPKAQVKATQVGTVVETVAGIVG